MSPDPRNIFPSVIAVPRVRRGVTVAMRVTRLPDAPTGPQALGALS
jgi:hypothetical protein